MPVIVKSPCIIESIYQHADELFTLELRPLKRLPRYQPGQFLHLSVNPYDPSRQWPDSRVFSIANFDPESKRLRVIYSVKGNFTKLMRESLKVGSEIWIKMPYGDFTFKPHTNTMVFIAGGTGITPYISYLEYLEHQDLWPNIILHYGTQDIQHLLCEKYLDDIASKHRSFIMNKYLERGIDSDAYKSGRLSIQDIAEELSNKDEADYYLSGPPEMIRNFKQYLLNVGVANTLIHIDAWE